MYVTAEQNGRIFLRHCSYGSYTGKGWAAAPDHPGSALPSFSAKAVANSGEALGEQLSIRLVSADTSLLYVPYYTDIPYTSDAGVSGGESEYSLSYMRYDAGYRSLSLPAEQRDAELSYRQFVYSNYLSLPTSTAEVLSSIANENSLRPDDRLESVSAVAEYVRNSAEYDIDTLPYPSDDYAVYLLTEANSGYCVHFATAATAMFRAIGIPARLVTGVAFDAEAGRSVEVLRENEHAWVEVYIDGTGWLPVEVTPGSLDGEAPGTESPQPESPSPEPSPMSIPTPENSGGENSVSIVQNDDKNTLANAVQTAQPVITVAGCILLLPLLCLLWYLGRRFLWKRQLSGDRDRAALGIWRCARRICSFGAEMPEIIEQSAQRSFYGRGLGSSKELSVLKNELDALCERTYAALPWYRKIIFKYVYGLK